MELHSLFRDRNMGRVLCTIRIQGATNYAKHNKGQGEMLHHPFLNERCFGTISSSLLENVGEATGAGVGVAEGAGVIAGDGGASGVATGTGVGDGVGGNVSAIISFLGDSCCCCECDPAFRAAKPPRIMASKMTIPTIPQRINFPIGAFSRALDARPSRKTLPAREI